jgi:Ca2+-binding EF-hand superfamily protein
MQRCYFAFAAIAFLGSATALLAQDASLFDKLDKNQDGQIAADEVEGDAKSLFERLVRNNDENKDGKLSKEEFAAAIKRRAEEGAPDAPPREDVRPRAFNPEEMFARADKNGDGKISKEEAPERLSQNFERLDANGSGFIEKEEFTRAMGALLPRGPAAPQPRPEFVVGAMVLKALDADGDGEISASEIEGAAKALAKFDKNGDGKLGRDELLSQVPRPVANRPAEGRPGAGILFRLKDADANGDGKISKEEAPEPFQRVFDRIDGNSDGQLDEEEIRKFREARLPRP